jgi:hypothetical protein
MVNRVDRLDARLRLFYRIVPASHWRNDRIRLGRPPRHRLVLMDRVATSGTGSTIRHVSSGWSWRAKRAELPRIASVSRSSYALISAGSCCSLTTSSLRSAAQAPVWS